MERDILTNYWVETANRDYKTMLNLYASKDYHWSLFIGHLVIEKLLNVNAGIFLTQSPVKN
jgi:HEPN domain-containing protein